MKVVSTCDVGYLRTNFSLPRSLRSRVRPDVRDRQTDIRQTYVRVRHTSDRRQTSDKSIAERGAPPYGGGGIITNIANIVINSPACQLEINIHNELVHCLMET